MSAGKIIMSADVIIYVCRQNIISADLNNYAADIILCPRTELFVSESHRNHTAGAPCSYLKNSFICESILFLPFKA